MKIMSLSKNSKEKELPAIINENSPCLSKKPTINDDSNDDIPCTSQEASRGLDAASKQNNLDYGSIGPQPDSYQNTAYADHDLFKVVKSEDPTNTIDYDLDNSSEHTASLVAADILLRVEPKHHLFSAPMSGNSNKCRYVMKMLGRSLRFWVRLIAASFGLNPRQTEWYKHCWDFPDSCGPSGFLNNGSDIVEIRYEVVEV